MTVCIASTNIKHNVLVFATDRMVTTAPLPIEFEHKIPKIAEVTKYCVGLVAGSALRGRAFLKLFKTKQEIRAYQFIKLPRLRKSFTKPKGCKL